MAKRRKTATAGYASTAPVAAPSTAQIPTATGNNLLQQYVFGTKNAGATASRNPAGAVHVASGGAIKDPLAMLKGAKGGSTLDQRSRRGKDPAAVARRKARAALGITDIRTADAATIRRLKAKGLLPGALKKQASSRAARESVPQVREAQAQDTVSSAVAARQRRKAEAASRSTGRRKRRRQEGKRGGSD